MAAKSIFKPHVTMGDDLKAPPTFVGGGYLPPVDRDQITEYIEATTAAENPVNSGYSSLITEDFYPLL